MVFPHMAGKGSPLRYWPEGVAHLTPKLKSSIFVAVYAAPAELAFLHVVRGHPYLVQIGVQTNPIVSRHFQWRLGRSQNLARLFVVTIFNKPIDLGHIDAGLGCHRSVNDLIGFVH
jgi:hypothetical protein